MAVAMPDKESARPAFVLAAQHEIFIYSAIGQFSSNSVQVLGSLKLAWRMLQALVEWPTHMNITAVNDRRK